MSAGAATAGEEAYAAFVAGADVTAADVAARIGDAVDGAVVETCTFGYWRKAVARIRRGDGSVAYCKLAFHPFAAALLRNEAKGFAVAAADPDVFTVPDYRIVVDEPDFVLAVGGALPGTTPSPRRVFARPRPPFRDGPRVGSDVAAYLARLPRSSRATGDAAAFAGRLAALADRFGNTPIELGPSHGDFVYWNTLAGPGGTTALLDFEYFSPRRCTAFDAVYWRALPLLRLAGRRRLPRTALRLVPRLAAPPPVHGGAPPRLLFALYLADHAGRMLEEHALPDIGALIGGDALRLREAVIACQMTLLDEAVR